MTGLTIIPTSIQIVIFQIETPSKVYLEFGYLQTKPFYREVWFVVALAASSIVIIIMVVAILCVKSKTYKYKGKFFTSCIPGTGSLKPPLTCHDPLVPGLCPHLMFRIPCRHCPDIFEGTMPLDLTDAQLFLFFRHGSISVIIFICSKLGKVPPSYYSTQLRKY